MEAILDTLVIKKANQTKKIPKDSELGFGIHFTDHLFVMDYSPEEGWHSPTIQPYSSFMFEPSSIVFHYGQAVFEGIKAFMGVDGKVRLFRVEKYLERMKRSCEMLCIPDFNAEEIEAYLKQLILLDKVWIPKSIGTALYIRPLIIARDNALGVRVSNTYTFFIVLNPVGPYYPEGFNPVKILVEETYSRTAPGGLGAAKTAANYAASLYAANKAKHMGYTQVLWLDSVHKKYVEEVGTMNIFFLIGDELITPPLEGTVLSGITRASVIEIAKRENIKIFERKITIDEVFEAHKNGTLKEVFGSGTAAVISPVGHLTYKGETITINNNQTGELSKHLFETITNIQYGIAEDTYNWTKILE